MGGRLDRQSSRLQGSGDGVFWNEHCPVEGSCIRQKQPSSSTPIRLSHGLGTAGGMCDLGVSAMLDPKVCQLEAVTYTLEI